MAVIVATAFPSADEKADRGKESVRNRTGNIARRQMAVIVAKAFRNQQS